MYNTKITSHGIKTDVSFCLFLIEYPRLWKPQYFKAESLDYGEIRVRFEVPPDDYNINVWELSVTNSPETVLMVDVVSMK